MAKTRKTTLLVITNKVVLRFLATTVGLFSYQSTIRFFSDSKVIRRHMIWISILETLIMNFRHKNGYQLKKDDLVGLMRAFIINLLGLYLRTCLILRKMAVSSFGNSWIYIHIFQKILDVHKYF